MKDKKGFTLIELLIVIGIIAILASAVIVAINPGRQFEQGRNATRWSHMNSVMNAVYSSVISEAGAYPECLGDDPVDIRQCEGDLSDFISSLPEDPSVGGTDYSYEVSDDDFLLDTFSNEQEVECVADLGPASAEDCTGYIIGFTGEDKNQVRIVSPADEAIEADVRVIQ